MRINIQSAGGSTGRHCRGSFPLPKSCCSSWPGTWDDNTRHDIWSCSMPRRKFCGQISSVRLGWTTRALSAHWWTTNSTDHVLLFVLLRSLFHKSAAVRVVLEYHPFNLQTLNKHITIYNKFLWVLKGPLICWSIVSRSPSGSLAGLYVLVEPVGELNAPISHRLWLAGVEALPNPMVEAGRPSKTLN